MRSILDKALAALLEGKQEEADKLFHDFVLERARVVNESIVETGAVDVDAIVGEAQRQLDPADISGWTLTADGRYAYSYSQGMGNLYVTVPGTPGVYFLQGFTYFEVGESKSEAIDNMLEDPADYDFDPNMTPDLSGAETDDDSDDDEDEQFESLGEGKTYKRNDDDAEDKKAEDKKRKEASKQKREVAEGEEVAEGKTYKRNEDDAEDKKAKDKERKEGAKQKREVAEGEDLEEGKTFKRGKDEDAEEKKAEDKKRKDAAKQKREVTEGQLEMTQGDDGVLHVTHSPEGSGMDAALDVPAPMDAGLDADTALDMPLEPTPELPPADLEMDMEPMPGVEDLNDPHAFESLKESLADELEKIIVGNKDHTYADGKKSTSNDHSPVPNVAAKDRVERAGAAEIKGTEHNGFDREPAPAQKKQEVRTNVRNSAEKGTTAVSKEGTKGALLNQIGDDKTAKSPVGGK